MSAHLLRFPASSLLLLGCSGPAAEGPAPKPPVPVASAPEAEPSPVELEPEAILFGLQSQLRSMRACLTEPGAQQLRWEVDKYGNPTEFEVVWSTIDSGGSFDCLTALISQRQFELPNGAQRGRAEWTFVHDLPKAQTKSAQRQQKRAKKNRNQGVVFEPPGSLDSGEVDGVVQGGLRLYGHCLRAGVEARSSISGRLALSWNVDARGQATEMTDAGSDLGDQQVVDCAAECFYALQYPKPTSSPVRITYSLLFNED